MPVFLEGLAVRFFRGIGPDQQLLGPFKSFNFFVGANNAGKSTILDLIRRYLSNGKIEPAPLDTYTGPKSGSFQYAVGIDEDKFLKAAIHLLNERAKARNLVGNLQVCLNGLEKICSHLVQNKMVWVKLRDGRVASDVLIDVGLIAVAKGFVHPQVWEQLWRVFTAANGGGLEEHWIPQTLKAILDIQEVHLPKVRLVPTHRQVGAASEQFRDFSGAGLIGRLAELQSPDHDRIQDSLLFNKINSFLQTVTGRNDARIEIPHNRQHVLVHMDNKVLPLSSLGTGIHEVIMLAAFCTISENEIVCIEEPESHLHPLLQRKLIAFLQANTSNQYFIATHSPSFIDTPEAAVFHVTNDGVQTTIKETILRSQRFAICEDLGIRASDLVQSNFVVWVEGPSDRLYVRRWIEMLDSDLEEGIHYSIMFYGGRLLSHLTANDDDVTEFIKLRSLNQNLCIIIDSDKASAQSKINETKKRIIGEFENGAAKAWVTKGREIENYVPFDVLQSAVAQVHQSKYHSPSKGDQYSHALHFRSKSSEGTRAGKVFTDIDKVKVAKIVTEKELDLNILDLKKNVSDLVERINLANR